MYGADLEGAYGIYEAVVNSTESDLILLIVILTVAAPILYLVAAKARKAERQCQREREKMLIDVVERNTAAFTDIANETRNHVEQSSKSLDRIHTRIDELVKPSGPKGKG